MYQPVDLGPGSLLWRWAGDGRIGFLGGTIGLLQLLHPAIGAGVTEHSDFFNDPFDRIARSLPNILGVIYDGPDAEATGRKVRDFHRDIKGIDAAGRRYHALDPATYWWAHATFQFMAEQVAERFDAHRLTTAERDQLYLEGVEWYRRYGVSDRAVPPDYAAFRVEWDRVCTEVLEMNAAAEWVLESLHAARALPGPSLPAIGQAMLRFWPARRFGMHGARLVSVGGLPSSVRKRFGIPWSRQDAIELALLERTVRRTWPLMPASVRWHPRARAGHRRVREQSRARMAA